MSFLDNSKNAGTALWIVGILMIVFGIVNAVYAVIDNDTDTINAVAAIGTIIAGFIYFGFGKSVRSGEISEKWDILCVFVKTVAIVSIIVGIFELVTSVSGGIVSIIVGIIIYFIYTKITDGKATTFDKIIWIILVIVFLLGIIGGILEIATVTVQGILLGICDFIIYCFMFIAVLDKDVKAKMGM